jgi:peroxiredoxin
MQTLWKDPMTTSLEFSLPAAGADELSLGDASAGRPATVVAFTCNHCPYALAWHERLQDVAREYGDRVGFVQINSNDAVKYPQDSFAEMEKRVAAGDFASPYLHDESQQVAKAWGALKTPHVFVIDANGAIVYQGALDADHAEESLRARWLRDALEDVLAGRPVALSETTPRGCAIKWR